MLQVPCNVSSTSSHTNLDYFQLIESAYKKDNISQISDKSKRYILARDIRKYENEQHIKQNSESVNISAMNQSKRQYLSVDQRNDQLSDNSNSQLKLTGINTQNKDIVFPQKFLSPTDITKKQIYPINQPELKKNKNEPNIQQIKENIMTLQGSKSTNIQVRKYIGPNLLQNNDPIKDNNIFLEKNNPINRSMYKEFNIGPRIDKDGQLVQHTLVGNPQWYNRQKELAERPIKQNRRSSQFQRDSFGRNEEEDRLRIKNRSVYNSKVSTENPQSSSFGKQASLLTEKSFILRPDSPQSAIKQQVQQQKKRLQKKNEQIIEVSKDQLIRELRDIERRHVLSVQREKEVISQMRLDDRNIFTRDERVLKKHQRHLSDWDKQIYNAAEQSSRVPTDSCMLRGEQHRRKVEYAQAFSNLKSQDERFGKRQLKYSLNPPFYKFKIYEFI